MSKLKAYTLKIRLADYPKDSVVVDDDGTWLIGGDSFDHRGSIAEGEMAMLFDYLVKTKSTSLLAPVEESEA